MIENAIIAKIEVDNSHNIVFLGIKNVPGIESIINEVQKYVNMNIEKYTRMSTTCESMGAFAAGMVNASWYELYKTAYLVLCIPKSENEDSTGHQIYTKETINTISTSLIQHYITNSISYAFLCSHNDSMFDIWDVCVDNMVRTSPGSPSHKAGTRMTKGCVEFIDLLVRYFIPETKNNFINEGIAYPGTISENITLPVSVELFARKDNIPAIKAYINAGLTDNIESPVYVKNMPWLERTGFGPLSGTQEFVYLSYTYKYSLNPIKINENTVRYVLGNTVKKNDETIKQADLKKIKDDFIEKIN